MRYDPIQPVPFFGRCLSPFSTLNERRAIFFLPNDQLVGTLVHSLLRNYSLTNKNVDQPLQWLHVLPAQQIIIHSDGDEMYEAAVQLQVPIDVPKWVLPMTVVEVRIAAEHLLDDASYVGVEVWGKAGGFANPVVVLAGELGKRSRERGRRSSDSSTSGVVGRGRGVTRGKGSGRDRCGRVGWEGGRIVNLADNPLLDTDDV